MSDVTHFIGKFAQALMLYELIIISAYLIRNIFFFVRWWKPSLKEQYRYWACSLLTMSISKFVGSTFAFTLCMWFYTVQNHLPVAGRTHQRLTTIWPLLCSSTTKHWKSLLWQLTTGFFLLWRQLCRCNKNTFQRLLIPPYRSSPTEYLFSTALLYILHN